MALVVLDGSFQAKFFGVVGVRIDHHLPCCFEEAAASRTVGLLAPDFRA